VCAVIIFYQLKYIVRNSLPSSFWRNIIKWRPI